MMGAISDPIKQIAKQQPAFFVFGHFFTVLYDTGTSSTVSYCMALYIQYKFVPAKR